MFGTTGSGEQLLELRFALRVLFFVGLQPEFDHALRQRVVLDLLCRGGDRGQKGYEQREAGGFYPPNSPPTRDPPPAISLSVTPPVVLLCPHLQRLRKASRRHFWRLRRPVSPAKTGLLSGRDSGGLLFRAIPESFFYGARFRLQQTKGVGLGGEVCAA